MKSALTAAVCGFGGGWELQTLYAAHPTRCSLPKKQININETAVTSRKVRTVE